MGLGRLLVAFGVALIVAGVLVSLASHLPFRLGRLPGDIVLRGRRGVFYFPLATCVLLSALVSLAMWLLRR